MRVTDEEEMPAQEVVAETPVEAQATPELIRITDEEETPVEAAENKAQVFSGADLAAIHEAIPQEQGTETAEYKAQEFKGEQLAEIRDAIPQEQEAAKEAQLASMRQELLGSSEGDQSERLAELDAKAAEYDTVQRYQHVKGIKDSKQYWEAMQPNFATTMGRTYEQYSDAQLQEQIAQDEAKQRTFGSKIRNSGLVRGVLGFFKGHPSGLMFSDEYTRPGSLKSELSQRERQRLEKAAQDAELSDLEGKLAQMPHAAPARQEDGSFSTQTLGTQYRFSGGFSGAAHRAEQIRNEQERKAA